MSDKRAMFAIIRAHSDGIDENTFIPSFGMTVGHYCVMHELSKRQNDAPSEGKRVKSKDIKDDPPVKKRKYTRRATNVPKRSLDESSRSTDDSGPQQGKVPVRRATLSMRKRKVQKKKDDDDDDTTENEFNSRDTSLSIDMSNDSFTVDVEPAPKKQKKSPQVSDDEDSLDSSMALRRSRRSKPNNL